MSMDRLDREIVLAIADGGEEFSTIYAVTAKVCGGESSEVISASRPKIRNRLEKINSQLDIFEVNKQDGVNKYRLRPEVRVTDECRIIVPDASNNGTMLTADAGTALVFHMDDTMAIIVIDSWI